MSSLCLALKLKIESHQYSLWIRYLPSLWAVKTLTQVSEMCLESVLDVSSLCLDLETGNSGISWAPWPALAGLGLWLGLGRERVYVSSLCLVCV